VNALIGLGAFVVVLLLIGTFAYKMATHDSRQPSPRARALRRERNARLRAERTVNELEELAFNTQGLDLVGEELRRQTLEKIRKYRSQELEERDK
jgi:hypothetical protein